MKGSMKVCLLALTAVVCLSIFVAQTEAVPLEVSSDATVSSTTLKPKKECAEGNPCGWAVYGKNKLKKTQYFIRNTCQCQEIHPCSLSNEDLSLTAFVYRCIGSKKNPDDE